MPIEMQVESGGGTFLTVHASGTLVKADYGDFVAEFDRLVGRHGKLRVLFDMTGFKGWDAGALWEEIKFDVTHLTDMERLAVIGDRRWHHVMTDFFKPFAPVTTRYFDHAEAAEARRWLGEG